MPSARKILLGVAILAVAGSAVFIFTDFGRPAGSPAENPVLPGGQATSADESHDKPASGSSGPSAKDLMDRGTNVKSRHAGRRPRLGEEEEKAIAANLKIIQTAAETVERRNSVIQSERKFPDSNELIICVTPPLEKDLGALYGELERTLSQFSKDSAVGVELRERGIALIKSYANFPKKFKLLMIDSLPDGKMSLNEFYVDDEHALKPNAKGEIRIPLPPQSVTRLDDKFGEPGAWSTARYADWLPKE